MKRLLAPPPIKEARSAEALQRPHRLGLGRRHAPQNQCFWCQTEQGWISIPQKCNWGLFIPGRTTPIHHSTKANPTLEIRVHYHKVNPSVRGMTQTPGLSCQCFRTSQLQGCTSSALPFSTANSQACRTRFRHTLIGPLLSRHQDISLPQAHLQSVTLGRHLQGRLPITPYVEETLYCCHIRVDCWVGAP